MPHSEYASFTKCADRLRTVGTVAIIGRDPLRCVRTTVDTPLLVFQSASTWYAAASESLVMIT